VNCMDRSDVPELHYITPIDNLGSILERGILSYNLAKAVHPVSVAAREIQARRERIIVPGTGAKLHEYANLYFNARNPMMYKRKGQHNNLCVIRINPGVLDLDNVIIADGNAASDYTRFYPSPMGLSSLDRELIFAEWWWVSGDEIETFKRRTAICAEVLVPNKVPREMILGLYISTGDVLLNIVELLGESFGGIDVSVNPSLFFGA